MKKTCYLVHPFETYGDPEENREKERFIALMILSKYPELDLIRPLKEIPTDIERKEAMNKCLELIKESEAIILSPNWNNSDGCFQEYLFAKEHEKEIYFFNETFNCILPDPSEEKRDD